MPEPAELLPCPFCGSTDVEREDNGHVEWLECQGCHATGPYTDKDADAGIDLSAPWNRRASQSQKQDSGEKA